LAQGVPYALSEDEEAMRKVVGEFARDRVGLEAAERADRHDEYPAQAFAQAAELGLAGLLAPGSGLGGTIFALAVDELAQVDASLAAGIVVHNAALSLLEGAGLESTRKAVQEGAIAALLVTEEATGSDAERTGTVARPDGDGYRITGQKVWGVNAAVAKNFVVLAKVPDKGLTLFLVPRDRPGITVGENDPLLGLRAAGIRTVYLSNVGVPKEAVVGEPGKGLEVLASARRWLQLGAAAALNGCVAGALEAAARFSEERIQFNQPVGKFQAVSDALTRIDVELAASRSLVLAAAARNDATWAARAKVFAAEMAIPMTRQAIRVQGGTGFMRHGGTERFARDARALQFLGEPAAVQRDIIRRDILDLEFPPSP
jgi:butyryl-CoA dehydrogenase